MGAYARPPSIVDLDVWASAAGKYNSQARVISHVGDKEILTVNAALFGHGAMYLFSQDGELMATASQSLIVRVRD